jgi:hypothetical protein
MDISLHCAKTLTVLLHTTEQVGGVDNSIDIVQEVRGSILGQYIGFP